LLMYNVFPFVFLVFCALWKFPFVYNVKINLCYLGENCISAESFSFFWWWYRELNSQPCTC
jgi:hypothetical protein